ncbi:MAG: hypothetical protein ACRDLQ_00500 [Solirubrobacterales bacterium]
MNADGTGPLNLSANPAADMYPSVSPRGDRVAFASFRDAGDAEIYVMNADGSGQTRLTNSPGVDSQPTWSPDGQRIAFRTDRDGDWEIYVMNADGSGQTRLTNSPGVDAAPAWSPDGGRVLFESKRDGNREIYAMSSDGSGQVNLTAHPDQDQEPSWSPDGQRIAFRTDRAGDDEIYTMTPAGAAQTRITTNPATDSAPAWSPDASKILFRSTRDGNSEIYVMGADGDAQTGLTAVPQFDGHPEWQTVATGYARPRAASPIRLSLVPAYRSCTDATGTHGPPLEFASCNPPAQRSPRLTVGTPDANGASANSIGSIRHRVLVGTPGPPDDSDIRILFSLSDVRCSIAFGACASGALSDYTGELEVITDVTITDRDNATAPGGGTEAATVIETPLAFTAQCVATAGGAGGLCALNTSANAIVPGTVRDGQRMLITMSGTRVTDGGPDGLAATEPNDVFAVQGIFIP